MAFQTNDIHVARLELAAELCKDVTKFENKLIPDLKKDIDVLEKARLIRKVVAELTKASK